MLDTIVKYIHYKDTHAIHIRDMLLHDAERVGSPHASEYGVCAFIERERSLDNGVIVVIRWT